MFILSADRITHRHTHNDVSKDLLLPHKSIIKAQPTILFINPLDKWKIAQKFNLFLAE